MTFSYTTPYLITDHKDNAPLTKADVLTPGQPLGIFELISDSSNLIGSDFLYGRVACMRVNDRVAIAPELRPGTTSFFPIATRP